MAGVESGSDSKGSVARVRAALAKFGLDAEIKEFDASTRTSADAEFVRAATGFAIGGVAPVGHTGPVTIFIDQDLRQYGDIWAAAGSPNAVFRLTPADLERITGGRVIAVK